MIVGGGVEFVVAISLTQFVLPLRAEGVAPDVDGSLPLSLRCREMTAAAPPTGCLQLPCVATGDGEPRHRFRCLLAWS